jgi:DNA-binding MarR family transcriptional regulator
MRRISAIYYHLIQSTRGVAGRQWLFYDLRAYPTMLQPFSCFLPMQFKELPAYRLRRVAESVLGMAEELFDRHLEVRVLDWRVLAKLADAPGSNSTDIGRDMLLTPVQTGRSLVKLRELHLVAAVPDPQDGRATRYTLTDEGRIAFETGMRIVLEVQTFALRDLNAIEHVALSGLLERLVRSTAYSAADVDRLSDTLFGLQPDSVD